MLSLNTPYGICNKKACGWMCGGGVGGGVYNNAIILRMITCGQSSYVEIGFGLSVKQHCHSTFSETSGLCKKKKTY